MTAYVHKLVPYMWQPFACSVASVVFNSLQHYGLQPARLLSPWDCPGKSTGMGCHALLQAIFPTQESNPCFLHWRAGSLTLAPPGMIPKERLHEWTQRNLLEACHSFQLVSATIFN